MEYLARHNKVWQHIKSGDVLTNQLKLKNGESLTDYRQIPKLKEQSKQSRVKKNNYFIDETNSESRGAYKE